MEILILKRNQIVVEELKKELYIIKQDALELSLSLLIHLKNIIVQIILSYKEYSLVNIRERGLKEILWERAMRFFKLENDEPEKKKENSQLKSKQKKGGKYWIKKVGRVVMYPFYILILLLEFILIKKEPEPKRKINKYVKNTYIE